MKIELIDAAARLAAEAITPWADLRAVGAQLLVHAAGGLLVLLMPANLSVYKPPGLTRYGARQRAVAALGPPLPIGFAREPLVA